MRNLLHGNMVGNLTVTTTIITVVKVTVYIHTHYKPKLKKSGCLSKTLILEVAFKTSQIKCVNYVSLFRGQADGPKSAYC